jgi:LPXTG-motif cell wall-anchored protein
MLGRSRYLVCAVLLSAALTASPSEGAEKRDRPDRPASNRGPRRHWVPEFDPATAGVVAAIIAGGGVLLARRRKRN